MPRHRFVTKRKRPRLVAVATKRGRESAERYCDFCVGFGMSTVGFGRSTVGC